jgi:hypothetical protein
MKTNKITWIVVFGMMVGFNQSVQGINFGQIEKGIETAAKIGKTVAGVVQGGLQIATIGVQLWGSDADKARFAKVSGFINIGALVASGDFDGAKDAVLQLGGTPSTDQGGDLVGLINGNSESPVAGIANAVGDIKTLSPAQLTMLNASKKIITVNDLKIGQLSDLKDQIVFEAMVPAMNTQQLIQLPNGQQIVLQTRPLELGLRAKMPYKGHWQNYTQIVVHRVDKRGMTTILNERGSIVLTKDELAALKTIWCNITNNTFGIFHTVGQNIILSDFIQFNQGTVAQQNGFQS